MSATYRAALYLSALVSFPLSGGAPVWAAEQRPDASAKPAQNLTSQKQEVLNQRSNYSTAMLDTRLEVVFRTGTIHHEILTGVVFLASRCGQRAVPALNLHVPVYRATTRPNSATNTNETETDMVLSR